MLLAGKPYPQPLPLNPFVPDTPTHGAYEECLLLEQKKEWNEFADDLGRDFSESIVNNLPPVVVARVLGHALRLAPSDDDRGVLAREIMDCKADPKDLHCSPELLAGLAHFVAAESNASSSLPPQSTIPKGRRLLYRLSRVLHRRSFEEAVNARSHLLTPPLATTQTLRQRTLSRDENCCVSTGDLDLDAGFASLDAGLVLEPSRALRVTNVAHIISQSLSSNIDGMTQAAREKFDWASTAAAVLKRFGGFSTYDILGGDNLNSAVNAFTVTETPHVLFDCLNLWLVPAQDEHGDVISNTYDVRYPESTNPQVFRMTGVRRRISFRSVTLTDGAVVPPPHPRILALHAVCAQVAHLSGAAEHVSDVYRDSDGISVMTEPNAPTELMRKLKTLQLIPQLLDV
ncbi:hypothetical protein NLJ89_g11461 [Agrocybe chaxingu]|uniref:HNH nuclease domain-containing protein n=1 Tax=Agrocybe chaxingu TaxID=84603 RepID=A0A9W8JP55_9AGAR|nr:hypothetical protein NLJ89_g11461 [Agrocybe chaxingu]